MWTCADSTKESPHEIAQCRPIEHDEDYCRERLDDGNPREAARGIEQYKIKLLEAAYDGHNAQAYRNHVGH